MTKSQTYFYKKYFKQTIKQIKAYAENNSSCDQERIRICCGMLLPFFCQYKNSPYLLEYLNTLENKLYVRTTLKDSFLVGGASGMVFSQFNFETTPFASLGDILAFVITLTLVFLLFSRITPPAHGIDFLIEDWERNALTSILLSESNLSMP